jgi:hypothetical protein
MLWTYCWHVQWIPCWTAGDSADHNESGCTEIMTEWCLSEEDGENHKMEPCYEKSLKAKKILLKKHKLALHFDGDT